MGIELFVDAIVSANIFGLAVGADISTFDSRLRLEFFEEISGRRDSLMLRRDYGLFEATFVDPSSWRCSNLIVEVHRLASIDGLADDVRRHEGVSLPRYVTWTEVERAIDEAGKAALVRPLERIGTSVRYGVVDTGVVVDVLDDGSSRTDYPGAGDLLAISLTRDPKAVR